MAAVVWLATSHAEWGSSRRPSRLSSVERPEGEAPFMVAHCHANMFKETKMEREGQVCR